MNFKKNIPLVIGNWKLNPVTLTEAEALAHTVAKKHKQKEAPYVGITPTALHLLPVAKKIARSSVLLGAQTVSPYASGAHTGEQSVGQYKDASVQFIIIGHSERRASGTTDADVRAQVEATLAAKLTPVVCIGEAKRDRDGEFFVTVANQIKAVIKGLLPTDVKKIIFAYEPIWAIGTGKTATAADVKEMQLYIEKVLTKLYDRPLAQAVRLLYGGSVKPDNAATLHTEGGMNGFLVGGASLRADDFIAITEAVTK